MFSRRSHNIRLWDRREKVKHRNILWIISQFNDVNVARIYALVLIGIEIAEGDESTGFNHKTEFTTAA